MTKSQINLPKTAFSMKANLPLKEPEILEYWRQIKLYEKLRKNSKGKEINVKLTPHLNISDNLHYAQNIQLPGTIDDLYDVTIYINPPKEGELGIHYDWKEKYGFLLKQNKFEYKNLSFNDIALKSRR